MNQGCGLQLFSKDFRVDVRLFDATNKYNKKSFEVQLAQQVYGLDILRDESRVPFVFVQKQTAEAALSLSLAIGNVYHKNSDLPEEEIDFSDLEL